MTLYRVEIFGGCLGEWTPDGTRVVVDSDAEVRPMDFCSIIFRPGDGHWARFMRKSAEGFEAAVKVFMGAFNGVVMVGQLVPPVVAIIPLAEIEALHRVVAADGGLEMTAANDLSALDLIRPLGRLGKATPPINPAWRPGVNDAVRRFLGSAAVPEGMVASQ